MEDVAFTVLGVPKGMGSSKAVPMNRNWRNIPGVRWRVLDSSHDVDAWQKTVTSVARGAMIGDEPIDGPVVLQVTFELARPKTVKREYPSVAPDLDKLVRAIGDALTGIVWVDDSQVVNLHAWKRYSGRDAAQITVSRIGAS